MPCLRTVLADLAEMAESLADNYERDVGAEESRAVAQLKAKNTAWAAEAVARVAYFRGMVHAYRHMADIIRSQLRALEEE